MKETQSMKYFLKCKKIDILKTYGMVDRVLDAIIMRPEFESGHHKFVLYIFFYELHLYRKEK